MQGHTSKNNGTRFFSSSQSLQPSASANNLPPLAQEVLDIAHKTLKPLEAFYYGKNLHEQRLREIEAAIDLSQRDEIIYMHNDDTLYAFFQFFSSDKRCTWLARYREYCRRKNTSAQIRLELLTIYEYRNLIFIMDEFYALFPNERSARLDSVPARPATRYALQNKMAEWEKEAEQAIEAARPPVVVIKDRMRTEEEWVALRESFEEWAGLVDPIICGKQGQDMRWASAVYNDVIFLGQQCSPRFLEMADGSWGISAEWDKIRYEITDEYERLAFLNMVNRKIRKQKRAVEHEQFTKDYLVWMENREKREERLKKYYLRRKEKLDHEKSDP